MRPPKDKYLSLSQLLPLFASTAILFSACNEPDSRAKKEQSGENGVPYPALAKDTQSIRTRKPPSTPLPPQRKPTVTELPVIAPNSLPLDRQITDSKGRKLDVIITARYDKEIAVIRKRDAKPFDLPMEKLSEEDLSFVRSLPVSEKPREIDDYIKNRQKLIANLQKNIDRLNRDVTSGSLTTSQMRAKNKEAKSLGEKIQVLERAIEDHQP